MKAKSIRETQVLNNAIIRKAKTEDAYDLAKTEALLEGIFELAAQVAEANEHLAKLANPLMMVISQEEADRQLRDQFAIAAMQLVWSSSASTAENSMAAYMVAWEMMRARK